MYVTGPLSACRKSSSILGELPNEGPFSGYLVITDVVAEAENTSCWGTCEITSVMKLPFPHDRVLTFEPVYEDSSITKLWFIPALDRPLSLNIYYIITADGKYQGKSCICSRYVDIEPTCFSTSIKDTRPSHFDPRDTYQVFQIHRHNSGSFFAESVAPDGFPPKCLQKKSWEVFTSHSLRPRLEEALGLDMTLRARLPDFTFPISGNRPTPAPVVWEELHTCENNVNNKGNNEASVNVALLKEEASVFGMNAVKDEDENRDGFLWFRVMTHDEAWRGIKVGVMTKEGGWVDDGDGSGREVRVKRVEEFKGGKKWKRFGCYVLVESFVLTRLDGSVVLKCDFRRTHRIQCKWE
ncbi:hypothetical protein NL676_005370 [Syzygium grande]|nr:hypothetical protein NL676_005370 [Syzygium grande]